MKARPQPDVAAPTPIAAPESRQLELNASVWKAGRFLSAYDNRLLLPAEVLILARFREALSGRVLDVGCGAGRLLAYLVQLGADAHGVDISSQMVEHCRLRFPDAEVTQADLMSLSGQVDGPFDAVLMSDNVLDVADDAHRRAALADVRRLLVPGGLLAFSSHNLANWEGTPPSRGALPARSKLTALAHDLSGRSIAWTVRAILSLPRRRANHRRLAPLQYRAGDHAVVNDSAHDYSLLHYYISRGEQVRQLAELGYSVVDVLELDGRSVAEGEDGRGTSLYYVATAAGA